MSKIPLEKFNRWHWFGESKYCDHSVDPRTNKMNRALYLKLHCTCERNTVRWVHASSAKTGRSKSCGCLQKEVVRDNLKNAFPHRQKNRKKHALYGTWNGMNQRCNNSNEPNYHRYGGRGISVFLEWHQNHPDGFENFCNYMGKRPTNYTLDRIDNDGNYEPENVRWASKKTQIDNRSPGPKHRITNLTENPAIFGNWQFDGQIERRVERGISVRFCHCLCTLCQTENWVRKQDLINNKSSQCKSCYQNRGRLL